MATCSRPRRPPGFARERYGVGWTYFAGCSINDARVINSPTARGMGGRTALRVLFAALFVGVYAAVAALPAAAAATAAGAPPVISLALSALDPRVARMDSKQLVTRCEVGKATASSCHRFNVGGFVACGEANGYRKYGRAA